MTVTYTKKQSFRDTRKYYSCMGIFKDVGSSEVGVSGREYMSAKDSSWGRGGFFHFLAPVLLLYSYTFPETARRRTQNTEKVNYNEFTKHLFIPQNIY